jgi:hypothetical protein
MHERQLPWLLRRSRRASGRQDLARQRLLGYLKAGRTHKEDEQQEDNVDERRHGQLLSLVVVVKWNSHLTRPLRE